MQLSKASISISLWRSFKIQRGSPSLSTSSKRIFPRSSFPTQPLYPFKLTQNGSSKFKGAVSKYLHMSTQVIDTATLPVSDQTLKRGSYPPLHLEEMVTVQGPSNKLSRRSRTGLLLCAVVANHCYLLSSKSLLVLLVLAVSNETMLRGKPP